MSHRRITSCFFLLTAVFLLAGCGWFYPLEEEFDLEENQVDRPEEQIVIGMVPSETVMLLLNQYDPLMAHFENKLGISIQPRFASSYAEIIQRMENDEFDLVMLAPLAYVKHTRDFENPIYEAVMRPVQYGESYYRGIVFSDGSEEIDDLSDLQGKNFAFVDQDSASGFLFPIVEMIDRGAPPPEDFFQDIGFLGRHDQVARAVHDGEYDAGATYNDARPEVLPDDVDPDKKLPILFETRKIPTAPIVMSKRFRDNNPELASGVIETMLNLQEAPNGQAILDKLGGTERYIEASSSDYDEVRTVLNTLINDAGVNLYEEPETAANLDGNS